MFYKPVKIGSAIIVGNDISFPLSYIVGDIIAEIYGYSAARQLIWFSLFCVYIFVFFNVIAIHLPYPNFWHNQEAFSTILGTGPRFCLSATAALLVGEFTNVFIISKWKIFVLGRFFWLRSIGATAIGQIANTFVMYFVGLLGIITLGNVGWMIMCAYFAKMLYALIMVYPASKIVSYIKNKEKTDVYDYNTDFNPFKITS